MCSDRTRCADDVRRPVHRRDRRRRRRARRRHRGHVGQRDTEFFIRNWVFPGGWIPSLAEVIVAMERHGLEVVDIENHRIDQLLVTRLPPAGEPPAKS